MIKYSVEENALKYIEQKLGNLSSKAPSVLKKAVNDTAKQTKKMMSKKAKETYTVKKANFNEVMRIKSATVGNQTAVISAKGEALPLTRFKVSSGKKTTKVQVLKKGNLKELKKSNGDIRAFVNNIAAKGQVRKKDSAKGKAGSKVIHNAVAQRDGKARLGIQEKYSNSLPAMLGSARTFGELEPQVADMLKENIDKHIKALLEG